ncbi:MAG: 16S rRNA (guanine(527)-N(7))-methyltransferase RsmG [Anaerolineales bacterium]
MEKLIREAQQLFGISLSPKQVTMLAAYERELLEWNAKFNLTAIRDVEGIRTKHFLDSFSAVQAWKANPPTRLVDVGTGAGLPGIALKILYPSMRLTLVESVGKKANFCLHIVKTLALENVEVLAVRAEDVGQMPGHREKYDWAVARAVAAMPVLAEYLLPLVKVGGGILAQKGESGPAEAQAAEKALKMLGGRLRQLVKVELPGVADERYLVIVDKTAATPPGYPRRAGVPAQKPL